MSEEEKKAIEKLDYELTESYVHDIGISKETLKLFKDIIKKQQEEIESIEESCNTCFELQQKEKEELRDKIREVINKFINEKEKEKEYRYTGNVEDEQELLRDVENEILGGL